MGAQGQATDILIQAEEITNLKNQLNLIYNKHTGKTVEFIRDSLERDKFMNPQQALEFGLIDKILEHPPKGGEEKNRREFIMKITENIISPTNSFRFYFK